MELTYRFHEGDVTLNTRNFLDKDNYLEMLEECWTKEELKEEGFNNVEEMYNKYSIEEIENRIDDDVLYNYLEEDAKDIYEEEHQTYTEEDYWSYFNE